MKESRTFEALATDYDGTLAHHGAVSVEVVAAVERLRASGRKLVLVTGREVEDLKRVFPEVSLSDLVVAENGGLLYWPTSGKIELLAKPVPDRFARELRAHGVAPISIGRVLVATVEPHGAAVLDVVKRLAPDIQLDIIPNKNSIMVLPLGVDKATGLLAGLAKLGLSPDRVVGVGDAENDEAFLAACGCGVAVANALAPLKRQAHFITRAPHGHGVIEVIEELIENDLAACQP